MTSEQACFHPCKTAHLFNGQACDKCVDEHFSPPASAEQRARELLRANGWKEGYALVHSDDALRLLVAALTEARNVR